VVLISETQSNCPNVCESMFPKHTMFSLPHVSNSPGGGLCTLISNEIAQHATTWCTQRDLDCLWVKVAGEAVGLDAPLFIGNCYLPCASSDALRRLSLAGRYMNLSAAVAEAQTQGYVILAGDMNAKVDHVVPIAQQDEDGTSSGLSQAQHARDKNESGRHMRMLCHSMGLQWLTGCVVGDLPAPPSFYHSNGLGGESRVDHILVAEPLLTRVVSSTVRFDITGSDHYPVEATFHLVPPGKAALRRHGKRLRWARDCKESFRGEVEKQLATVGDICAELGTDKGNPLRMQRGLDRVVKVLVECSLAVGCTWTGNARGKSRDAPWFDRECLELRKKLRRMSRRCPGSSTVASLNREFRSLCKQKKKSYGRGKVFELMEDVKANPHNFWKHFKSRSAQGVGDVASAVSFWSSILNKDSEQGRVHVNLGSLDEAGDHELNQDITAIEVSWALERLKSGTASGPDGLPPELFKYADVWAEQGSSFAEHLAYIFNCMFSVAWVPADWGTALLTLVYKSGGRADWGNYRPVAVMQGISKVFASVLNERLMSWGESNGIRAPSQAGFRPKHSTCMQAFVLRHLVEQHRHMNKHLYACFVDFRKAYDSVPRDKLWRRLHAKGIRGRMLFTLQALYANVSFAIKFPDGLSEPIPCNIGVRQGCPLSPFLFGVYIEMLDEQLRMRQPTAGPVLHDDNGRGTRVPLLLYADDLSLLGCSAGELQVLLNELSAFAESVGMSVNMGKTRIVIFRGPRSRTPWVIQGRQVEVSDSYKYLGLCFHKSKPLTWTAKQQVVAAKRALGGMLGFYNKSLAEQNVWLLLLLFKAIVMPSLLYGCEVWGSSLLSKGLQDSSDEQSRMRLAFFRRLLGVRKSTSSLVMLRELGEYPLQFIVVRQLVSFWNKVMSTMPEHSLVRISMLSNRRLAMQGVHDSWFGTLYVYLDSIGCSELVPDDEGNVILFDWPKISRTMRGTYHARFRGLSPPNQNVSKLSTYQYWFAGPLPRDDEDWVIQGYLRKCMKYKLATKLARFRLGSHNLRIECEKWKPKGVQVAVGLRFCQRCHQNVVDDECHAIFHCSCFHSERGAFPEIFGEFLGDHDMKELFNSVPLASKLAKFLDSIAIV
jgi:Reverse transcriptase (RNA-dependent DNA polymerase)